jgi:hypothetical protein
MQNNPFRLTIFLLMPPRINIRPGPRAMCDKHGAPVVGGNGVAAGALASRRRRIWELGAACHCPLIGVGIALGALRKLVGKVLGGAVVADDYQVHVGAVSECGARNRLSEALQKALERRYADVVKHFQTAKTVEQLGQLWRSAMLEGNVAGAFWAGLTHPRCDGALEEQMCRHLHMVQHQLGASVRADIDQLHALQHDKVQLAGELHQLKVRSSAQLLERLLDIERRDAQLMQARGQAIASDGIIDGLRAALVQLQASLPALESRTRLALKVNQMAQRERAMKLQIGELKNEINALKKEALPAVSLAPALAALAALPVPALAPICLVDQSVLCVGGRSGNVATYRALVERGGAQFAHHDGGLEDNVKLLDASLAAADLVICQTGCISHGAYWRVKDHCKRTGKRCVFIDNPSISSLARGLQLSKAEEEPCV